MKLHVVPLARPSPRAHNCSTLAQVDFWDFKGNELKRHYLFWNSWTVCMCWLPIKKTSPCRLNSTVHIPDGLLDGCAHKGVPLSAYCRNCCPLETDRQIRIECNQDSFQCNHKICIIFQWCNTAQHNTIYVLSHTKVPIIYSSTSLCFYFRFTLEYIYRF